jgi:hypothetical protein
MSTATKTEVAHALRAGAVSPVEAARLLEGEHARVVISGQFAPGSKVTLYRVAYPNQTPLSGVKVATAKVDKDGVVEFDDDIEIGRHYQALGENTDGDPRQIQATGKVPPAQVHPIPTLQADPVPEPETKEEAKERDERAKAQAAEAATDPEPGTKEAERLAKKREEAQAKADALEAAPDKEQPGTVQVNPPARQARDESTTSQPDESGKVHAPKPLSADADDDRVTQAKAKAPDGKDVTQDIDALAGDPPSEGADEK